MAKDTNFITQTEILKRGWTKTMVKKFLGEPDKKRKCMMGICHLYSVKKIEAAEHTAEFKEAKKKSIKRKAAAQKAAQTKRDGLKKFVQAVDLKFYCNFNKETIIEAIEAYNDWTDYKGLGRDRATKKSDKDFLKRITGNYIRHECSNYENILSYIKGKTGCGEEYFNIRDRFDKNINAVINRIFGER